MGENYNRNDEETKYVQTSSKYGLDLRDAPQEDSVPVSMDRSKKNRALKVAIVEQINLHNRQKQLYGEFTTIHTHLKDTTARIDDLLSQWDKIGQVLDNLDTFLKTLIDENADIDEVNQIIDILIRKQNKEHLKSINKYLDT